MIQLVRAQDALYEFPCRLTEQHAAVLHYPSANQESILGEPQHSRTRPEHQLSSTWERHLQHLSIPDLPVTSNKNAASNSEHERKVCKV